MSGGAAPRSRLGAKREAHAAAARVAEEDYGALLSAVAMMPVRVCVELFLVATFLGSSCSRKEAVVFQTSMRAPMAASSM